MLAISFCVFDHLSSICPVILFMLLVFIMLENTNTLVLIVFATGKHTQYRVSSWVNDFRCTLESGWISIAYDIFYHNLVQISILVVITFFKKEHDISLGTIILVIYMLFNMFKNIPTYLIVHVALGKHVMGRCQVGVLIFLVVWNFAEYWYWIVYSTKFSS